MPRYAAESGTALALARKVNIALDIFGVARLASLNLIPDPTLSDFEPDGSLRYWPRLEAPPNPTGRNVYIREPGGAQNLYTRQNDSPLPREQASYKQSVALIHGAPMPPVSSPYKLPAAETPTLYADELTNSGYAAGDYLRSFCWAVRAGSSARQGWLLTGAAPPVTFTAVEGQETEQPLPQEVPEGVDGIAIVDSEPDGTFERLFVQKIVQIGDFAPEKVGIDGPLRLGRMAPEKVDLTGGAANEALSPNQTYIGRYERYPGPRVRKRHSHLTLQYTDALISWRFRTQRGWSASQGTTRARHRYIEKRRRFEARPHSIPSLGRGWVLQIQGPDGGWNDAHYGTAGDELNKGQWGWWTVADPQKVPDKGQRGPNSSKSHTGYSLEGSERTKVDQTGVPDPDEALEAPLVFGQARISTGKKVVRVTDVYTREDGSTFEGPPSAPVEITLGANEALVVDFRELAEEGNAIPNGELEEQEPEPGSAGQQKPRRTSFNFASSASLIVNALRSVVDFDDATNRTTDEDLVEFDRFSISDALEYTLRGGVNISTHSGGAAEVRVAFDNASNVEIGSQTLVNVSSAVKQISQLRLGPVGSGLDVEIPAGAKYARLVCRLLGSSGARSLIGRFIHLGLFRGLCAPRKRPPPEEEPEEPDTTVPEEEPEEEPYPTSSYMRVVENPSWAEGKGNGFEYYGTPRAILDRRYFASGLQVPVEGNRVYCLQAGYFYEGIEDGSEALPVVIRNAQGEVVEQPTTEDQPAPLLPGISGDGDSSEAPSGVAYTVIETPSDAAYIEIEESTLGSGLLRAWGFQLEYGTVPTAWTNDVAASGLIGAAFDTRTPGVAQRFAGMFAPRLLAGGAVYDEEYEDGTVPDVTLQYRGRASEGDTWSAWHADITTMPRYRYIEVEATLNRHASDPAISPEVSALFAEAESASPVLLRADGSEYPGGVLVNELPAVGYADNAEIRRRSDGSASLRHLYDAPREVEFSLLAYLDEAASEVSFDSARGSRLFVVEGWGKRLLVQMPNVRFKADRASRFVSNAATEEYYVHTSDAVRAEVLQVSEL
ncbi:MAG: hypothetical protein ACFB50_10835 [Rubrobacteraceae bacterium]